MAADDRAQPFLRLGHGLKLAYQVGGEEDGVAVPAGVEGADARHELVVEKTRHLIEDRGFRGIKLYPPIGYHPNDRVHGHVAVGLAQLLRAYQRVVFVPGPV